MDLNRLILYFGFFIRCVGQIRCSVSCQFDFGLCGWTTIGTSMYSWRTNSGQTMDRTSGPMNDVTCKNLNGKYAYLPGTFSKRGEKAVLESERVDLKNQIEVTFWLSMKGVGIGSMEVLLKFMNETKMTIWSRQGEQDTGWQREHVKIGPGSFKILFQGSVNLPYGSDIAIDDVILGSENTAFDTSHCARTTRKSIVPTTEASALVPTSTKKAIKHQTTTIRKATQPGLTMAAGDVSSCHAVNDSTSALPGSCDFENGLCNLTVYANEDDQEVVWMISNKRDPYYFTAPITWDHTFKNGSRQGHYLNFQNTVWLKFDRNPYGKNASVETPVLMSTSVCLSFWYIMPTKDANLLLYIEDLDNTVRDLWQSKNVTPHWSNTVISIKHDKPFKIVFQSRNKNYNAKVALDDILITRVLNLSSMPVTSVTSQGKSPNTSTKSPRSETSNKVTMANFSYWSKSTTLKTTPKLYETTLRVSARVPIASKSTPQRITVSPTTAIINSSRPSKVYQTTKVHTSTSSTYIEQRTSEITTTVSDKNKEQKTTEISMLSTSDFVRYKTTEIPKTDVFHSSSTLKTVSRIKSTTEMNKNTKKPAHTTKRPKSSSNKTAEQSGHRFRNSSTVIGYSVGGLVFVTVVAVVIYFVHQYVKNKRQSKRTKSSLNHKNGQDNGGFFQMHQTSAVGQTVLPPSIEQNMVLNNEKSIANGKQNGHSVGGDVIVENGHNILPPKHSESANGSEITSL